MKVIWENIAKQAVKDIAKYIRTDFGVGREAIFRDEVRHVTELLMQNPYMGALDPLFEDRAISYRSVIVSRKNKLVYYVDGKYIHISAFWDCRQDPVAQAARVK